MGLAGRAQVVKPRLFLLDRGPPLGLAAGRGVWSSTIAFTPGLLALPPAEIEGVLAHELAHVRNRDIVIQTPVVLFSSALLDLSRIGGFLERALLFVLGPVSAACEHILLSPNREYAADRLAAEICDSPHGLAAALIRLEQAVELVEFQASPACEPLFTVNPLDEGGPFGDVRHAPARGQARGAAQGARPRLAREDPRCLKREKAASRAAFSKNNPAASYSPGGFRPEYHRRWRA